MLKLWGRVNSANVQKVIFLLEELGRPYERIDAGMEYGVVDSPQYRARNPNGLIPTIDDDGFVLWESNSILRYLAAKDPQQRFHDADARRRADIEKWMDWQLSVLTPPFTTLYWGLVRAPGSCRAEDLAAARAKTERAMTILDTWLAESPWISGSALGLADFALAPFVHRWFEIPGPSPSFASASAYRARLLDVPSAKLALP